MSMLLNPTQQISRSNNKCLSQPILKSFPKKKFGQLVRSTSAADPQTTFVGSGGTVSQDLVFQDGTLIDRTSGKIYSLVVQFEGKTIMTRWARANNVHKHKPADATPWNQLKANRAVEGGEVKGASSGASWKGTADPLRGTQSSQQVRKPKRRKKDFNDTDVNGFLEYLQQTGQPLPAGNDPVLRKEVETALKKDKRRENRRIKRQMAVKNNMVCFNCRKPGHGLADCPEADGDEEMGRGICYRCGSTEHEIQKCRAKVDPALGDYPFAKCFICSQTGHLSRSCPDNPKGLYAAGGCCRICGSVEHFQKDCPEHHNHGNAITVGRLSNKMSADHEDVHVPVKKMNPKSEKVVVF
ncbi:zinc finger CCHC domain-containing protein 9-like [Arapaima gigas]